MILQVATLDDIFEITKLVNSAYRGELAGLGWTTEADYLDGVRTDPEQLRDDFSKGRVMLILKNEENVVAGCVQLEKTDDGNCYLGMLTVHPTLQAGGLGRRLLSESEEFVRTNWGAKKMYLGVIQLRDTLIAWYERRGYRLTGETKPYPYDRPEVGIPKRNDMHFVMFSKDL